MYIDTNNNYPVQKVPTELLKLNELQSDKEQLPPYQPLVRVKVNGAKD